MMAKIKKSPENRHFFFKKTFLKTLDEPQILLRYGGFRAQAREGADSELMADFLYGGAFVFFGVLGVTCIKFAWVLMRADKGTYNLNKMRSSKFPDSLFGKAKTVHEGTRDFRVKAGLAYDPGKNMWVEQGTLSDEAINALYGKRARN